MDGPRGAPAGAGPAAGGYAVARTDLLRQDASAGPLRRTALARLTDDWLAGLFDGTTGTTSAATGTTGGTGAPPGAAPPGIALVAVGGYGRGELSPGSDLDLLLLHDGTAAPETVAATADRLWYPVWDHGLALDHSVRTAAGARRTAGEDLKVQLGLLDARHIAGDPALTSGLRTAVLADWREQAPRRLPELRELCRERGRRHGELQFLLEPDLKEARGGLRDLTALRAVAASWLADAPREGLADARTQLLDARDALHLATGRTTDRLALQEQDQVAAGLGLMDADILLRRLSEAARTVSYAADVTWRDVGRVLGSRRAARTGLRGLLAGRRGRAGGARTPGDGAAERTPLAEGVVEQDGEAVLARTARPEQDPVLPLRAAAAAARAGLPLSRHSVRRMAAAARPLPVPWPADAREMLVTLLGAGEPAVAVWEALEAEGLVTRLLPDWERVRCCPQRNAVHRWTVDRHLVETAVRAGALSRRVGRPDLLLIAALLHDIGKGWPGDHSVTGEVIARDVSVRIGFGRTDTDVLATLVRHHLLLVETATRRDLDDPATVQAVAEVVGSIETLELLHALTEADALATGPAAWSAWRASLVDDLVKRVSAVLAGEPAEDRPDTGEPTAEQERLAVESWRTGAPVLALRTRPDPELRPASEEGSDPGETAEPEAAAPERLGAELVVALPDRPGVLPAAAGVLALHRLTVRAADLRLLELPADVTDALSAERPPAVRPGPAGSGPDGAGPGSGSLSGSGSGSGAGRPVAAGVLLLTWRVAAEYGSLPEEVRLRQDLVRTLDGSLDIRARLAERESAGPSRRGVRPPPPRVTVAPAASRHATVLEVRAQDGPGLLHRIGRALDDAGVQVRSAHVSTLGGNAVDAFYLTGGDGAPLTGARAAEVARAVEQALN